MAKETNRAANGDQSANPTDLELSDEHSLELLGRVYSEAVTRRAAKSTGEVSAPPTQLDSGLESADQEPSLNEVHADDGCPINPRTILEAMLFVGIKDAALTARKAASLIRGVSANEVDQLVAELNQSYTTDQSAFRIRQTVDGYRLVIEDDLDPIRQQFFGRIREARLGNAAIEVLAVVAYHQPVTLEEVDRLRNRQSGPVLNLLVRRDLLSVERDPENRRIRRYRTTTRFLELFGMDSIDDLPQAHLPHGADFLDE